ncbi:MAG: DUF1840 domain-containing protein [Burkholderiaceae bacterium]|nr:DUF1840 domain-containing protein [Burkholderiaceae bacterium]
MLYRFKSRAEPDLIMLEPQGRQMLELIGKTPEVRGIVTLAQIPAAVAALEAAIVREAAQPAAEEKAPAEDGEVEALQPTIGLRQQAAPFLTLLRRSAEAGCDVVWGV